MDLSQQTERCYQKQPTIFENKKRVLGARRVNRSELRFTRNVGLGFKAPQHVSSTHARTNVHLQDSSSKASSLLPSLQKKG